MAPRIAAIPTLKRRKLLTSTAGVLTNMPWLGALNIRDYDDASSLCLACLRDSYPSAVDVVKRSVNPGPDRHRARILKDFQQTSDEALVFLDSDLLARRNLARTAHEPARRHRQPKSLARASQVKNG
jgi:hypothetical protein